MFQREVELVECADRNNWKYVWVTRAPRAHGVQPHLGERGDAWATSRSRTERIHLGSGIFNLSPAREPSGAQRRARRDARPPQRRAASSSAPAAAPAATRSRTFNIHDTSSTRSEWDEVVWELPRMWATEQTTRSRASTSPSTAAQHPAQAVPRRRIRRSGSRAATRRPSRRRASSASARSASTSRRSTT